MPRRGSIGAERAKLARGQVCELNIQRIRVIWARVWPIVASHLVAAGGHTNANLAMYAVDALRQLANRLLVKGSAQGGAAAHHLFQSTLKEALWPFRELFGECLTTLPSFAF